MANCNVQNLLDTANCFSCLTEPQLSLIKASLLCQILKLSNPMANCDPQSLLDSAKCFECLTPYQLHVVVTQLLCEILNAGGTGGSGCLLCSQSTNPVNTPACDCALFYRRDNGNMWFWDSTLGQWILLIGG